jgi:hypothetical protein
MLVDIDEILYSAESLEFKGQGRGGSNSRVAADQIIPKNIETNPGVGLAP